MERQGAGAEAPSQRIRSKREDGRGDAGVIGRQPGGEEVWGGVTDHEMVPCGLVAVHNVLVKQRRRDLMSKRRAARSTTYITSCKSI